MLFFFSIEGQERYGNMTRVYYREAVGALVVFDMTRLSTFQAVLKWKGDLDSKVRCGKAGSPEPQPTHRSSFKNPVAWNPLSIQHKNVSFASQLTQ